MDDSYQIPNRNDKFTYFRELAQLESIELMMEYREYGRALYSALEMADIHPNNKFLISTIVDCLYEIAAAQKKHQFSSVVENYNRHQTKSYNDFLHFLHQISLSALKKITYDFYLRDQNSIKNYEYGDYVGVLAFSLEKPEDEVLSMKKNFSLNYKNSYFSRLLDSKIQIKSKNKNQ